jgi:hypothetical protein
LPAFVVSAQQRQRLLDAFLCVERDGDPARLVPPLVLGRHRVVDVWISQLPALEELPRGFISPMLASAGLAPDRGGLGARGQSETAWGSYSNGTKTNAKVGGGS